MCFSATASFTASAVLIPLGVYCINYTKQRKPGLLPYAISPLAFGLQQLFEGLLWLSMDNGGGVSYPAAVGFTFFSHFFWLFWIPFSVWCFEPQGIKKNISLVLTIIGALYGASLYFPMVINEGWLQMSQLKHSIVYHTSVIYDGIIPRKLVRLIYALLVMIPMLMQSNRYVRYLGVLTLLSVLLAKLMFGYAFISVWCFFAAILSIYVVYFIRKECRQAQ